MSVLQRSGNVCAEVLAAFHRYEDALLAGDVEVLVDSFADSPDLVRFGIADLQVGSAQVTRWRWHQPAARPGRRLFDTRVMAVGADTAVVTTLFDYPGEAGVGRQSQIWQRTDGSWKVVHAHVSAVAQHA